MCKFTGKLDGKDLFNEVKKVLNVWTAAGKTFTKYEVTQEVRKNVGNDLEVLHSDVRLEVENLMSQAFKEYVHYNDSSVGAVRYAPAGQKLNPNRKPVGSVVNTANGPSLKGSLPGVNVPQTVVGVGNQGGGLPLSTLPHSPILVSVVVANKKGVCVPKELVKRALNVPQPHSAVGLKPRVWVHYPADQNSTNVIATTYQPDRYNNVTVLNSKLKSQPGEKFELSVLGNGVHFKKV